MDYHPQRHLLIQPITSYSLAMAIKHGLLENSPVCFDDVFHKTHILRNGLSIPNAPWCWNMYTNIYPNKITQSCRFVYTSTIFFAYGHHLQRGHSNCTPCTPCGVAMPETTGVPAGPLPRCGTLPWVAPVACVGCGRRRRHGGP